MGTFLLLFVVAVVPVSGSSGARTSAPAANPEYQVTPEESEQQVAIRQRALAAAVESGHRLSGAPPRSVALSGSRFSLSDVDPSNDSSEAVMRALAFLDRLGFDR